MFCFKFLLYFCVNVGHYAFTYQTQEFTIRMPNVHPKTVDTYLHTTQRLLSDADNYIVSFEPLASMESVHHMMIHGCQSNEILKSGIDDCSGKQLFYVWGRNAPNLELPEGVGFKVGKNAGINSIFLEVHYANVSSLQDGQGDMSGVKMRITSESLPKRAGVFLLATGGYIKEGTTENFEVACALINTVEMHPFAFRTHTHERGILVSGYRVRSNENGEQEWRLLGKKNPLLPQFFYPVEDDTVILKQGDILAARCVMHNKENRTIYIGGTSKDEMCNFYIMYYVNGQQLNTGNCYSAGPPNYYWALDSSLNKIP